MKHEIALVETAPTVTKPKRWYKVGDDSRTLRIGSRAPLRSNPKLAGMSFTELDGKIDSGLDSVAAMVPYLQEMRARLYNPGKRSDLAPEGLTWTAWVASKKDRLKMSLRSVQYLLALPDSPHAEVASGSDKSKPKHEPTEEGRYSRLQAFVSHAYDQVPAKERRNEIHKHAKQLMEDF